MFINFQSSEPALILYYFSTFGHRSIKQETPFIVVELKAIKEL